MTTIISATASSSALPPRVKDLTGRVFGLLTVMGFAGLDERGKATFTCKCWCGKDHVTLGATLLRGDITSCGCYRRANMKRIASRHGMAATSEYGIWLGVKKRTGDKNHRAFARYGGRGITMCDSWRDSFETFYKDMGPRPTNRHTLERKDNSLGYSPENCVWATYKVQARNRRNNKKLEYKGENLTMAEWSERLGFDRQIISKRIREGWSIEKTITEPLRAHKKTPRHFGREVEDFVTC